MEGLGGRFSWGRSGSSKSARRLRCPCKVGLGFDVAELGCQILRLGSEILGLNPRSLASLCTSGPRGSVGLRGSGAGLRGFVIGLYGFGVGLRVIGSGFRAGCNAPPATPPPATFRKKYDRNFKDLKMHFRVEHRPFSARSRGKGLVG